MAASLQRLGRRRQVGRRQDLRQTAPVQQSEADPLCSPVPVRHPRPQVGQYPGRLVDGPGPQVLSEAVQPERRIHDPDQEVHQAVGLPLGPKSSAREQIGLERRVEPGPDGMVHARW